MFGIVHRHPVQQKEVLVVGTSTHENARKAVETALHPGKELQGLQHIGLSEKHRGVADDVVRYLHGTSPRGMYAAFRPGGNERRLQFRFRSECNAHHDVTVKLQMHRLFFITYIGIFNIVLPFRQRNRVKAEFVADGSGRNSSGAFLYDDPRRNERFRCERIAHMPLQRITRDCGALQGHIIPADGVSEGRFAHQFVKVFFQAGKNVRPAIVGGVQFQPGFIYEMYPEMLFEFFHPAFQRRLGKKPRSRQHNQQDQ